MVGGALLPGAVTVKASVRHCVRVATDAPTVPPTAVKGKKRRKKKRTMSHECARQNQS